MKKCLQMLLMLLLMIGLSYATSGFSYKRLYHVLHKSEFSEIYVDQKPTMRSDCGDIRITDFQGNPLKFWVRRNPGTLVITVDFGVSVRANTPYYMLWGNADSTTQEQSFNNFGYASTNFSYGNVKSVNTLHDDTIPPWYSHGIGNIDGDVEFGIPIRDTITDSVYYFYSSGGGASQSSTRADAVYISTKDFVTWNGPHIVKKFDAYPGVDTIGVAATSGMWYVDPADTHRKIMFIWQRTDGGNGFGTIWRRILDLTTGVMQADSTKIPSFFQEVPWGTGAWLSDGSLAFAAYYGLSGWAGLFYFRSTDYGVTWHEDTLKYTSYFDSLYCYAEPSVIENKSLIGDNWIKNGSVTIFVRSTGLFSDKHPKLGLITATNYGASKTNWGTWHTCDSILPNGDCNFVSTYSHDGTKILLGSGYRTVQLWTVAPDLSNLKMVSTPKYGSPYGAVYGSCIDAGQGYYHVMYSVNNDGPSKIYNWSYDPTQHLYYNIAPAYHGNSIGFSGSISTVYDVQDFDSSSQWKNGSSSPITVQFTYANNDSQSIFIGYSSYTPGFWISNHDSVFVGLNYDASLKSWTCIEKNASGRDTIGIGTGDRKPHVLRMDWRSDSVIAYFDYNRCAKALTAHIPNKLLHFTCQNYVYWNNSGTDSLYNLSTGPTTNYYESYFSTLKRDTIAHIPAFISGKYIPTTDTGMIFPVLSIPSKVYTGTQKQNVCFMDSAYTNIKSYVYTYDTTNKATYIDVKLPSVHIGECTPVFLSYSTTLNNPNDTLTFNNYKFYHPYNDTSVYLNAASSHPNGHYGTTANAIVKDTGMFAPWCVWMKNSPQGISWDTVGTSEPDSLEIGLWLYFKTNVGWAQLLGKATSLSCTDGYGVVSPDNLYYYWYYGNIATKARTKISKTDDVGKWIRLVCQYTGGHLRVFKNGILIQDTLGAAKNNLSAIDYINYQTWAGNAGYVSPNVKYERYYMSTPHDASWHATSYQLELNARNALVYGTDSTLGAYIGSITKIATDTFKIAGTEFGAAPTCKVGGTSKPITNVSDSTATFYQHGGGNLWVVMTNNTVVSSDSTYYNFSSSGKGTGLINRLFHKLFGRLFGG